MEWFAWMAPVWNGALATGAGPSAVQYGTGVLQLFGVVSALVPVLLVVRHAFRGRRSAAEVLRLRVREGGKELRRRAA
jgi:hypothetical protein